MKQQEFEDDAAFQMTKEGYCEACKGSHYMEDSGCYEDCDGFIKEYWSIVRQFEEENEIH